MIDPETLAILFGLASGLTWGAGDFSGGYAAKRTHVFTVIILSQIAGGLCLLLLALILRESIPPVQDVMTGAVAGVAGVIGLTTFYAGLARSRMGIVAPLSALVAAVIPITVGIMTEGLPAPTRLAGFALALVAVLLLSGAGTSLTVSGTDLGYALLAGVGFALFFILIDRASETAIFWPLVAARTAAILFLIPIVLVRREWQWPSKRQLPLIALAGVLDAAGTALFAMAARLGRLDLAATLASLYPASTVLLAQVVLHERLGNSQWLGVVLALLALLLITL